MNAESNDAIQDSVRVFISETPDLTKWAQSLDENDLLHELEMVEYSLRTGTLIVPPSSLVSLVQESGMKRKWRKTLKALRPNLPSNLGSSEREMCAIGLLWCELLMDTCSNSNGRTALLREVLGTSWVSRIEG